MARTNNNVLLRQLRGQLGKQLVVKRYGTKTVVTAYPDMSNVKPSTLQITKRSLFAEAVAYAQGILHDPVKKAAYAQRLKKGQRVYHAAIKEFLSKTKDV
ncbi:hypothetical protein ESA94_15735 [Lacibacter luteus]|uniref:Uncharacterized protein n=1 Tax=Lacibacter luteus TaxID=2508719 RepID=A0A4Q1CFU5_9BACT|nr:hypothetical protein [Lacibacter luteus]RXK58839.1 hypothetical protein ESA94_15735 [Lacibacter luteus]